jgi:hypothetical protein
MSSRLYRFGLERPSRRVLEDFLGRPVSPRAFLDDLARAARGDAGTVAPLRAPPTRG